MYDLARTGWHAHDGDEIRDKERLNDALITRRLYSEMS